MKWLWCILLLAILFCFLPTEKNNYTYLGGYQTLGAVDTYSDDLEHNEECMMLYGDRHCMMTDGRLGKCVLSGYCAPSMLPVDEELEIPYCTKPYFKEGCGRYCKCLGLSGERQQSQEACVNSCRGMFHPY